MANTKSAKKSARQNIKRQKINLARKSSVKSVMKKVLTAIAANESTEVVRELMRDAESQIGKAKNKIFHPNTSARKIGRLAKKVAQYEASAK